MADNRAQWDAWRAAEDVRQRRKSAMELWREGYRCYKQEDYRRAASLFRQALNLAEEQRDVKEQCEELLFEGQCWLHLGKLKMALERFLRADSLGGGDAGARFFIMDGLFETARCLPLPRVEQEKLLKKLTPYKHNEQIGSSKSIVLSQESTFMNNYGSYREALNCMQEAFACCTDKEPNYPKDDYYDDLIECYRKNGLLLEARRTLQDWRTHMSTDFASSKYEHFLAEAKILYAEGRLGAAWDAICRCQAEERYLNIHGQNTGTLIWLIRIAADSGRLREAQESLPTLFRFHNAESLFWQYDCFYWFAYYYAALWRHLRGGGVGASRCETPEIARKRAGRWYARAERVGLELDSLLETDVKRKELDELQEKL